MKYFFGTVPFLLFGVFLFSCNQPNPEMQRKVVFDVCACMNTKDALLIRDTLAMHKEIRMLHYTQCIFEHGQSIDPFDPSFRKSIEKSCVDLLPLHDAFVQAGTKKEKAAN